MRHGAVTGALAGLHLLLAWGAIHPVPHTGGDNAVYLALARSLLQGGYHELWEPSAPLHAQFPPGYPLILAGALAAGVRPWLGIKLVGAVLGALAVALTHRWLLRRRRPGVALGVGLVVATAPGGLALSGLELSDVPFWAVLTAALIGWERLPRTSTSRAAAAAALTGAAYLVRPAALPLVLAVGTWLLWRRRWRQAALFAGLALPPVLGWWLWNRAHGGYGGLLARAGAYDPHGRTVDAAGLLARAAENAEGYAGRFLPVLLTGREGGLGAAAGAALLLLAAAGWIRRMRRPGVAELMLPLYLGMLLVWQPDWSGERLLLPVLPLLLALGADGTWMLARRAGKRAPGLVGCAAAALLLLVGVPGVAEVVAEGRECTARRRGGEAYPCVAPAFADFFALAEVARAELPAGAVVMSRKPALFHAVSGHPGVVYPSDRDPARLLAVARASGARYLVLDYIDELSITFLTPVLMRRPDAFCVVHAAGPARGALLRITATGPDGPAAPDPGAVQATVGFASCPP